MRRIGIAIKSTLQGSGEAYKINPGAWDSKVVDIRDTLRHVAGLHSNPGQYVVFLSFSETGCYVTVARGYQNRVGDNIAGWLFIPSDIRISGDEVIAAIESVRQLIYSTELPAQDVLQRMFSKEYPLREQKVAYTPSPKNGRFAKRDITRRIPLTKIFDNLYQPYYSEYQSVFIEQRPGEITDAVDITEYPVEPYNPPVEAEKREQAEERRPGHVGGVGTETPAAVGNTDVWTQRFIGFFSAIVLGGIVVGILAICGVFSHKEESAGLTGVDVGESMEEAPLIVAADTIPDSALDTTTGSLDSIQ